MLLKVDGHCNEQCALQRAMQFKLAETSAYRKMRALEFTVKRIMIKLFRTYDSSKINSCMSHLDFPTVSELVGQRINSFLMKRTLLDNILFKVCQLL